MTRALWLAVGLMLALVVAISFIKPHEMVSPGNLMPAHKALEGNCFACHAPLRGASADRCQACHKLPDIGLRTTRGVSIPATPGRPAFHAALAKPDCMACHTDHARPWLVRSQRAGFDHRLLQASARDRCQSCHQPPRDELHRMQSAPCATCHQPTHWKPATFDHARFFVLDRHHNVSCATCHPAGNFRRYTCFGCHQHQPVSIAAEHREEGITNIADCVRCHRSAAGEPEGGGEGRREGGRESGDDD
jgi:hypothetical protein